MATRTPEEIRASIEHHRQELGTSLQKLRGEVEQVTDWRLPLRAHQHQWMVGAAAAGFVLGGGIAGVTGLVFGRRNRQRKRLGR